MHLRFRFNTFEAALFGILYSALTASSLNSTFEGASRWPMRIADFFVRFVEIRFWARRFAGDS